MTGTKNKNKNMNKLTNKFITDQNAENKWLCGFQPQLIYRHILWGFTRKVIVIRNIWTIHRDGREQNIVSVHNPRPRERPYFGGEEYVSSSFPFEDFTSFYAINFWATYSENYPCKTDKIGSISMFLLGVCVNFLFLNEMLCKFKHIDE